MIHSLKVIQAYSNLAPLSKCKGPCLQNRPYGRRLISIAEADLTAGPSKRLLKNEKKKVIVYTGIVVVVL
jgi:hypothetical protein